MALNQQPRSLPPFAQWVLTRRIPCAVLATLMFGSVMAFAGTALSLPLLLLHMLTPTLFALIALGGGFAFAMQVSVLSGIAVTLISYGDFGPGLILMILYGALPILAASTLAAENGMSKSGLNMAIGLVSSMLVVLLTGAASQDGSAIEFVRQLLAPLFAASLQEGMDATMLKQIEAATIWVFPGLMALSVWVVWWGDVMLARNIATYFGFYQGSKEPVSNFCLPRKVAYGFMILMVLANYADGTPQYLAVNAGLVFAGLLAAQGLAVVHTWLHAKRLQIAAIVMYVMLLIQPVMVLPFAMIGLLDIWFDYRRNIMPADGGK